MYKEKYLANKLAGSVGELDPGAEIWDFKREPEFETINQAFFRGSQSRQPGASEKGANTACRYDISITHGRI